MDTSKWIERYERKTGENFFESWDLSQFPLVYMFPDGSFFCYGYSGDVMYLGPTCGDFKRIYPVVEKMCHQWNLLKVRTCTKRNPKAYARLTGAKLLCKTEFYDGSPDEYVFEWEVYNSGE